MIDRAGFSFRLPLRVRWAECDAQGIVFFANYFTYFDVGMTEYFRALGHEFAGENALEFYTVHAEADYYDSAVYDDELEIGVRCARLGETSLQFAFALYRGNAALVEGRMIYVHAVPRTKTKTPVPGALIDAILELEKTPPERPERRD